MSMRSITFGVAVVVATYAVTAFGESPTASTNRLAANDIPTSGTTDKIDAASSSGAAASKVEEVMLGSPELTAGIPGSGPLKLEEIKAWLDNPKNNIVLKPTLPLGLAAGASQINGIDKDPLTRAKIELGRQLYFDTRLSKDNTISCASCHDPSHGYARETRFGVGVGGQLGGRNSPVAYNRILSGKQFWDGRAESLEDQAKGPIANPIEMSNTHDVCVHTVGEIPGYQLEFKRIFPNGVTIDNVAKAIASFERALVTAPSSWDYYEPIVTFKKTYLAGQGDINDLKEDEPELYAQYMKLKAASDAHPISESAKRGGELFFGKANCTACHAGANFSDEQYHNLGVGMDAPDPDLGRFKITNDEKDTGAFKTPTVRNVAQTAPYMHDGSQKTLEEVVEWYDKGGHPNPHLDQKVKPLKLTTQEKADLVAFMQALTGELPKVERGRLPE
jgi:cytochrome c peroxidase